MSDYKTDRIFWSSIIIGILTIIVILINAYMLGVNCEKISALEDVVFNKGIYTVIESKMKGV